MKLQLLGTGSSDGWPNPWCTCASCNAARECGELRGQTGVLVDDRMLIDCGPDVPRAAARLGVDLGAVELLLIGHAHPDHCGPQALMWRGWSSAAARPLEVIAPPAVVELCRPWPDPAGPDHASQPSRPALKSSASATGSAPFPPRTGGQSSARRFCSTSTGPDGARLLYAVDTAPLSEDGLPGDPEHPYDVVLLEETLGDAAVRIGEHHDLDDFAATIAALRRTGAVTSHTQVAAVHLGHGNPPGAHCGAGSR